MSAGGGAFGIGNVVEDLSPQLGGNLDLFNKTVEGTGNVNMVGVVNQKITILVNLQYVNNIILIQI